MICICQIWPFLKYFSMCKALNAWNTTANTTKNKKNSKIFNKPKSIFFSPYPEISSGSLSVFAASITITKLFGRHVKGLNGELLQPWT